MHPQSRDSVSVNGTSLCPTSLLSCQHEGPHQAVSMHSRGIYLSLIGIITAPGCRDHEFVSWISSQGIFLPYLKFSMKICTRSKQAFQKPAFTWSLAGKYLLLVQCQILC